MSDTYRTLMSVYRHADEHMSAADLQSVSDTFSEEAANLARRLSGVLDGIAALVLDDAKRPHPVGSFQTGETVFNLLAVTSQQLDLIAALSDMGSEAGHKATAKAHQGGQSHD